MYYSRDVVMEDATHISKHDELSDFTDSQKEYINRVLEEKLAHQREKLMNYFSVSKIVL